MDAGGPASLENIGLLFMRLLRPLGKGGVPLEQQSGIPRFSLFRCQDAVSVPKQLYKCAGSETIDKRSAPMGSRGLRRWCTS